MVYPAALVFLTVWLWLSAKDPDLGIVAVIAALPFGTFAAVKLGGLSLLVPHLLSALTLALFFMRSMAHQTGALRLNTASILILCFAAYSIFSAVVLVRLFAGQFLVFPMNLDDTGVQISIMFHTTLKPLAPSGSNLSQSGYILLSALVFVFFCDVATRRGPQIIETGLAWAAGINIALGAISLAGGDAILSLVRTADYTIAAHQTVLGMTRVIGGFSEPSAFGGVSAILCSYFAMSYMIRRRSRDGLLALGNAICTVLAFSSTGFASLFVAALLITVHGRAYFGSGMSRSFAHLFVAGASVVILCLSIAMIATPLLDRSVSVFDDLFLQKSGSESGLERFAWARYGFYAFVETWGLGAGVGSLRANGLLSVLLGSVGLLGAVLYVAFLWTACGPGGPPRQSEAIRAFASARVAALTMTTGQLLASTTPDPGLMLMFFAAVAASVRLESRQRLRALQSAPSSAR